MTPHEYAKRQRDFLIKTDKQSAVLLIAEFERIKKEIADDLAKNFANEDLAKKFANSNERGFLEKILDNLAKKVDVISTNAGNIVTSAQKRAINFLSNSLKTFKPEIKASIFSPDKPAVEKLIGRTQSGSTLSNFFQKLKEPIREKAKETLIEGFSAGESNSQIAKRINDVTEIGRWRAMTIARTETNEAYRAATREFYDEAEIPEYIWMSVLDARTCLICWHLHGQKFKSSKKVFSHPNCRCVLIPFTGQKVKTGAEIFESLEAGFQKQFLGKSRFELYQNEFGLSDFVNVKERKEFGQAYFIKNLTQLTK